MDLTPGAKAAHRAAAGAEPLPEPRRLGPLARLAPEPMKVVLNWGRRYSLWVFNFGLACCAIEFIAASMAKHDFIRLGVIPFAPGPRQADLMVVSGTVTDKMAPAVKRLYEQMPEPKYVISFGACSNCGGPYWDSYSVTKGVDQIIPVDVYVPGCPPRPEALLQGILKLQEKIARESLGDRYGDASGAAAGNGAGASARPSTGRGADPSAGAGTRPSAAALTSGLVPPPPAPGTPPGAAGRGAAGATVTDGPGTSPGGQSPGAVGPGTAGATGTAGSDATGPDGPGTGPEAAGPDGSGSTGPEADGSAPGAGGR